MSRASVDMGAASSLPVQGSGAWRWMGRWLAFMVPAVLLACGGGSGSAPTSTSVPVSVPASGVEVASPAFDGNVLLGAPTASSLRVSLLSAAQSGTVALRYGPEASTTDQRETPAYPLQAGEPLLIDLSGLSADTAYRYRVVYRATGATQAAEPTQEHGFHTARPPGSTFTFTLQADSHLDENSDLAQYRLTLANIAADRADFHIDLGDTFMTEKHVGPFDPVVQAATDEATVRARYVYERGHFAIAAADVPLFLVNGNHDGELGWLLTGSPSDLPTWATRARLRYFVQPQAGAFYGGDLSVGPFVGPRASWYAWAWGDALFIVLDPYWNSPTQASRDAWAITLGATQYRWLASTLAASTAAYKFVLVHNLVGGLDSQMRGGIEAAPFYEWGGRHADGSDGFAAHRPGWALPIHDLLVRYGVTAVFHGHDHLYAAQTLDGIVYQAVPQPSAANTNSGTALAREYHYLAGTVASSSGHLRVQVAPTGVTSQYVRSWLPAAETLQRRNRQVEQNWTVAAPMP